MGPQEGFKKKKGSEKGHEKDPGIVTSLEEGWKMINRFHLTERTGTSPVPKKGCHTKVQELISLIQNEGERYLTGHDKDI